MTQNSTDRVWFIADEFGTDDQFDAAEKFSHRVVIINPVKGNKMPTSPSQLKRGYKLHRRSRTKFPTEESAIEHVRMKTQRPIKKYTTHHTTHAWVFHEPLTTHNGLTKEEACSPTASQ